MKDEEKTKEHLVSQDVIKGGKRSNRGGKPSEELVVVGIGASAGGLEALRALLPGLPSKDNIAYIIVQHLDPKHRSMLTSLLSPCASLEVLDVKDRQKIRPNRIYVTPPAKDIAISKGQLRLTSPTASITGSKASVDNFLASLAKHKGDKAVGIILSGTGSDGAHGMRAIKAEGGITIVQDEATAKYSSMPRAAMETGLVDLILPPERIGPELVDLLEHPRVMSMVCPDKGLSDSLQRIFQLLLDRTGCDFSDYKLSTIRRRIGRRMAVHKLATLEDYVHCLEQSDFEIDLLFKDILVSVTSFFRDPQAFQALGNVLLKVIADKKPKDDIRIWVPGCATGEEAYSIAILLAEELGDRINSFNVQIFATDIDSDAITTARKGTYTGAVVASVDKLILQRYFTHEDGVFRVAKAIRELVVFAKQDLSGDPPFSRLDLVSCRNLLIYFNAALQKKLIPVFHHVLNPNGYLFLGKSESVGQFDNLFVAVDKKWRIFLRRGTFRAPALSFGRVCLPAPQMEQLQKPVAREIHLKDVLNEAIADTYGHPAAVIDDRLEIVFVRGDVSPYLSLTPGGVDLNILTMARSELRAALRVLIHRSTRENSLVCSGKLRITFDNQVRMVTLRVRPTTMNAGATQLTLVLFEEETADETAILPIPAEGGKEIDPRIPELEHELAVAREHLNTTVEELETANEEMQSLNEELESSNEELLSTNEELETTNEELQSTNEELTTLNEELHIKSTEVAAANTDLENILKRVGVALVIVDKDLKVTRFTPPARNIFALSAKDEGQVLTTIACHINLPDLRRRLLNVIRQAKTFTAEIEAENLVYLMRILPYYSEQNQIAGAVLIFLDQTDIRQAEKKLRRQNEELKEAREYVENIVDTVRGPLVVLDADLRVVSANRPFYKTFDAKAEDTEGQLLYDLGNRRWDIPRLRELLEKILPENTTVEHFEVDHDFPHIGRRIMLLNAQRIYREVDKTQMILLAMEDITERKRTEEELREHRERFEELVEERTAELKMASEQLRQEITERKRTEEALRDSEEMFRGMVQSTASGIYIVQGGEFQYVSPQLEAISGYSSDELLGTYVLEYVHPEDREATRKKAIENLKGRSDSPYEFRFIGKDGQPVWILEKVSSIRYRGERAAAGSFVNITERKRLEEELGEHRDHLEELVEQRTKELKESQEKLQHMFESATDGIYVLDLNGNYTEVNERMLNMLGLSSKDEILGKSVFEFVVNRNVGRVMSYMQEAVEQGSVTQLEYKVLRPDGSEFPAEASGAVLKDASGNPVGFIGISRDITERKRAEEALQETMADLERSNAELEQFAYIASHDLQEPLRMVSSYTQLLEQRYQGKLDADADDFIAYAVDGANRMQRMINDLLTYSRVGTRGKSLEPTYCEAVFNQVLANMKLAIEESGAVITHDPLPSVMADESQMVQLFQNLLDNAIKFRGDQPPQVHVGIESKDGEWVFSVRDNGIGIDPQYQDRIFVIFQRMPGKEVRTGTGMGLATCKKIVERHGGRIWVESKPGKGATFYFTTPKKGDER